MNITLRQYLERADEIHAKALEGVDPNEYLEELERSIRNIQSVSHRMAFIYNGIKRKTSAFARKVTKASIEPFPSKDDWRFVSKEVVDGIPIVPGIDINATIVATVDDIPNMPLFWVKDTRQFGFQLNGVLFLGNVGNIYSKSFSNRLRVTNCNKKNCGASCRFYHNPRTHPKKDPVRNFMSRSFLYTDDMKSRKNRGMRHVGNRNTMAMDMYAMKMMGGAEEIEMISAQSVHDVLTVLCANQCGIPCDGLV